jgi:hypothetical protein
MVRKYAIGLRENLLRCVEGLDTLKMSILQGGYGDIRDLRQDLMTEVQHLCSATYLEGEDKDCNVRPFSEKMGPRNQSRQQTIRSTICLYFYYPQSQ